MDLEAEVALLARDLEAGAPPLARAARDREAGADLEIEARALKEKEDGRPLVDF